jgi:hypothetical protein
MDIFSSIASVVRSVAVFLKLVRPKAGPKVTPLK